LQEERSLLLKAEMDRNFCISNLTDIRFDLITVNRTAQTELLKRFECERVLHISELQNQSKNVQDMKTYLENKVRQLSALNEDILRLKPLIHDTSKSHQSAEQDVALLQFQLLNRFEDFFSVSEKYASADLKYRNCTNSYRLLLNRFPESFEQYHRLKQ
jgi:hypothetical protein